MGKREDAYIDLISVDHIMLSCTAGVLRLADFVGANVPHFTDEDGVGAWKYRLACNVMRAIKRNRRKKS